MLAGDFKARNRESFSHNPFCINNNSSHAHDSHV